MRYEITESGDLLLLATNDERSELASLLRDRGYFEAEGFVRESLEPNGILYFVPPENIGALTEAPILTDEYDMSDGGDDRNWRPYPDAGVWWFPDYMVTCPWEQLAWRGRVLFRNARA